MNKWTIAVVAALLSGCITSNGAQRVRLEETGNPQHVRQCQFEAVKATGGSYSTRTALGQAMEDQQRKNDVFIACMRVYGY